MKLIKSALLGFLFLLSTVSLSFASEEVKVQNGKECIDLKVAYEQNNLTSQAITGEEKSLDAVKRAETMTSLTNIIGILLGDSIYCVNDDVAASKVGSFSDNGVFGFLSDSTTQMFSIFNTIDVTDHLAKEFIPGYGGNNATLARTYCYSTSGAVCTEGTANCYCYSDAPTEDGTGGGEEGTDVKKEMKKGIESVTQNLGDSFADSDSLGDVQRAIESANTENTVQSGYKYLKTAGLNAAWSVTRNIAYLFFVIVMIIIGFMIMFRNKIGGQLMVTVGNAIPRVVLSLLLVTFSFAIVGIMLDVGKVGIALVNGVFYQAESSLGVVNPLEVDISGVTRLSDQAIYNLRNSSDIEKKGLDVSEIGNTEEAQKLIEENEGVGATTATVTHSGLFLAGSFLLQKLSTVEFSSLLPGKWFLEALVKVAIGGTQYFTILAAVRLLLFLLVALYASIKLFITMLTTYFKIFVSVILAPIQLALGALPGNQNGMMNWFKSTFANILVFVVIVAVLRFFRFLSNAIDPGDFNFYGNKGVFFPEGIVAMKGIFIIASYLIAANAPTMVSGFMKIEENKTMSAVGGAAKASMSKIPLIGGMFGGK